MGAIYRRWDLMTPTPATSRLRPLVLFGIVAAWPMGAAANSMSGIGQAPLVVIGPLVGHRRARSKVGQSLLAVALAITPVCAVGYSAGMCTRVVVR
ncbi:MAG: hypothetical protein IV100_16060 [Myxococcales bacterium]|nr:hypothetical protein [Myxococcales bacterium]